MKKVGKIIKKYKLLIIGIVLGGIIAGGGVYASTVVASSVSYSNVSSGMSATNAQGAIDELYEMSTTRINQLKHMYCGEYIYNSIPNSGNPCASGLESTYSNCAGTNGCSSVASCKNAAIETYGSISSYCQYSAIALSCSSLTSGYNSCVNSKLIG